MLSSNLRLIRPLGEGGMGCVWLAEHTTLQCHVAVKFLLPRLAHEATAHERFRLEATAAARLRSAHVVQVLDHGRTDDGLPFIAMELLEGETLQDRVEREGPLSLELTVEVLRQAGRALAKAHDLGIVHRDVKPDNLFLIQGDADPFVKILDFGIARQLDLDVKVTSTGNVVGTPHFMAPEQMAGTVVLPACDVWSLGVVAYYCLTGQLPYKGGSLAALALAIDRNCPVRVSTLVSGLPAGFDAWLARALAPAYEARFANAREMIEALEHHVLAPNARPLEEDESGAEWEHPNTAAVVGGRFPTPGRATVALKAHGRTWSRGRSRRWSRVAMPLVASAAVLAMSFFGILQAATPSSDAARVDGTAHRTTDPTRGPEQRTDSETVSTTPVREDARADAKPAEVDTADDRGTPPSRPRGAMARASFGPPRTKYVAPRPPTKSIVQRPPRRDLGF